jgi:hypothetical protein
MNKVFTQRLAQFLLMAVLFVFAAAGSLRAEEKYEPLAEGKKYEVGTDYSFEYHFDKKPQLGIVIVKVQVADKEGKKNSSLKITGDSGMPSMPGHHDSGEKEFKLNKEGDYLLPVDVVMPGDWAVKVVIRQGEHVLYRGAIRFDI